MPAVAAAAAAAERAEPGVAFALAAEAGLVEFVVAASALAAVAVAAASSVKAAALLVVMSALVVIVLAAYWNVPGVRPAPSLAGGSSAVPSFGTTTVEGTVDRPDCSGSPHSHRRPVSRRSEVLENPGSQKRSPP